MEPPFVFASSRFIVQNLHSFGGYYVTIEQYFHQIQTQDVFIN